MTSPRTRRRLAKGLDALVRDADAPPYLRGAAAPINGGEIGRCATLIRELAGDLRAPGAAPQGVELVEILLRDAASPVYNPDEEGALESALREARAGLLLRPDQEAGITRGKRSSTQAVSSGSRS
jgi:hypothetical protein